MRRLSISVLALALALGIGVGCASNKKAETTNTQGQTTFKCAKEGCSKTKTVDSGAPAPS